MNSRYEVPYWACLVISNAWAATGNPWMAILWFVIAMGCSAIKATA